MFGVRFAFVATRNGLTRVRHFDPDDTTVKRDALAFAKRFARAVDETFYSRTVDFNLMHNETAIVVQVPFNLHKKISSKLALFDATNKLSPTGDGSAPLAADMSLVDKLTILANSSLHLVTTQAIVAREGSLRSAAGVTGVFHDFPAFLLRFFNVTNTKFDDDINNNNDDERRTSGGSSKPAACYTGDASGLDCGGGAGPTPITCGATNDSVDCLLVDNNGYLVASEQLEFIGRHLRAYDTAILDHLVQVNVFKQVKVTDNQAICELSADARDSGSASSSSSSCNKLRLATTTAGLARVVLTNTASIVWHFGQLLVSMLVAFGFPSLHLSEALHQSQTKFTPVIPVRTFLRPCVKTLTLYETPIEQTNTSRRNKQQSATRQNKHHRFLNKCGCASWLVHEPVPNTNLHMLIVGHRDPDCFKCSQAVDLADVETQTVDFTDKQTVCSRLEFEAKLYRRKLDTCYNNHTDETQINICGHAARVAGVSNTLIAFCATFVILSFLRALCPNSLLHRRQQCATSCV